MKQSNTAADAQFGGSPAELLPESPNRNIPSILPLVDQGSSRKLGAGRSHRPHNHINHSTFPVREEQVLPLKLFHSSGVADQGFVQGFNRMEP